MLQNHNTSPTKKQAKRTRRNNSKHIFISKLNDYRISLDKWTLGRTFAIGDYFIYRLLERRTVRISIEELMGRFDLTYRNCKEIVRALIALKIIRKRRGGQDFNKKYNGIPIYSLGSTCFEKAKLAMLCDHMPMCYYIVPFVIEAEKEAWNLGQKLSTKGGSRRRVINKLRGGSLLLNTRTGTPAFKNNTPYSYLSHVSLNYDNNKTPEIFLPTRDVLKERAIEKVAKGESPPVTLHPKGVNFLKSIGYKFENGNLAHV